MSATVAGVGTIYTTRYWLALDEVYNVKGDAAQNNAGVEHHVGCPRGRLRPRPAFHQRQRLVQRHRHRPTRSIPTNIDVEDGIDANDCVDCDDADLTIR